MIDTINHVGYWTDDLAAGINFYRVAFGAELREELRDDDGTRYAFLAVGTATIELIEPGDKAALAGQSGLLLNHLAFQVPDLDAALRDLAARGVRPASPAPGVAHDGLRYISLDPGTTAGTPIQLV